MEKLRLIENIVHELIESVTIYEFFYKKFIESEQIIIPRFESWILTNSSNSLINDYLEFFYKGGSLPLEKFTENQEIIHKIEEYKELHKLFINKLKKVRNYVGKHKSAYQNHNKFNELFILSPKDFKIPLEGFIEIWNYVLKDNDIPPAFIQIYDPVLLNQLNEHYER